MSKQIDMLLDQGKLDTVAQAMGDEGQPPQPPAFVAPRLEEYPHDFPKPGIYFGMSDEEYHAIPALSNSGIKKLAASPMIFWASTPWLSVRCFRKKEEAVEKDHHVFGRAYHCRLLEGAAMFAQRYAVELDPADYPEHLVSTDQIKAAIGTFKCRVPVKPCGNKKDDLIAQWRELTKSDAAEWSGTVDALKAEITSFVTDAPVQPVRKVEDVLPDGTPYMRDAVKADWIAQLMALDPNAKVFANVQAEHRKKHDGCTFLYLDQFEELEIAARMIERDPELKEAFVGGYAEVTIVWICPRTNIPMKARIDYLKLDEIVDLKSISNQRDNSMYTAIRFAIAQYRYNIQPVVYFEAAEAARELVRKGGKSAIHVAEDYPYPADEVVSWAIKWAKNRAQLEFLWVFQQKGLAPITRGVYWPREGELADGTEKLVEDAKKHFLQYSEVYGTEPWLDIKPIYTQPWEEVPRSATEI